MVLVTVVVVDDDDDDDLCSGSAAEITELFPHECLEIYD